jgi:hypothetical protein
LASKVNGKAHFTDQLSNGNIFSLDFFFALLFRLSVVLKETIRHEYEEERPISAASYWVRRNLVNSVMLMMMLPNP